MEEAVIAEIQQLKLVLMAILAAILAFLAFCLWLATRVKWKAMSLVLMHLMEFPCQLLTVKQISKATKINHKVVENALAELLIRKRVVCADDAYGLLLRVNHHNN